MNSLVFVLAAVAVCCNADPFISRTANDVVTSFLGNVLPSASNVQPTTCECGASRRANTRIINGQRIPFEGFVTVAAQVVNKTTGRIAAGGSLISPRHVLTVAHTYTSRNVSPGDIYVAVGNPFNEYRTGKVGEYTQKVGVERIVLNGFTGEPNNYNDIAILVLENPVELSEYVRVACLPKDNSENLAGQTARILGFGFTRNDSTQLSEEILSGKVKILSAEQCHKYWRSVPAENPKQFCVDSPTDRAAQGDSGNGVFYFDESIGRYVNVGIISFGALDRNLHYPRVNTKVSDYIDWIKSVVESTTQDRICTKQ